MSYNSNIPQATDQLAVSQGDLLNNFGSVQSLVSVNHVNFNGPDQGKHAQVQFPIGPLSGQPFTYATGEIGLQSLNQAPTNIPDIWMTRGTGTAFPITGSSNGTIGSNSAVSWTYLPSGLLMISGTATTTSGTVTITYNATGSGGLTGFPGFVSYITSIQATRIDNSGSSTTLMRVRTYTLTQCVFGLSNGSTDSQFFWTILGK